MERDERDFHALQEGLRRLALRLAALARGRGDDVDRLLDRLAAELRHVPSLAALEPLLEALAKAVTTSDDPPPAGGDPDAASIDGLRADIARLQELLAAVSLRLGDMTRYLAVELERTGVEDREGRALDASVREEMRALGETTLAAADLGSLQAEVAARLSSSTAISVNTANARMRASPPIAIVPSACATGWRNWRTRRPRYRTRCAANTSWP